MLTNPAYGGAYAYGKSEHGTRYEAGVERTNARRKPREQWLAFIPGTHEGYVEWERYERIQRAIRGNLPVASRSLTAAREGQALLAGLLRCRRCASKLTVHYTGQQHDVARYHAIVPGSTRASPDVSALAARGSMRMLQRPC